MSQDSALPAASGTQSTGLRIDLKTDYWQRKYGVPWSQLAKAVEAVNHRSAAVQYRVPVEQQRPSSTQL